jgi:hypothetical protein
MLPKLLPYHVLTLLLLLANTSLRATSYKQLDNFSAATIGYYYTAGVGVTTSTHDFFEGGSSLQVSYNLAPSGNAEIFRSYGTNTLDLSFLSQSLSLAIKGQASQYPQLRFMLYEDLNQNGDPFEQEDDIFEFVAPANTLNNPSWSILDMPYSAFTKFGGGSSTLDLNRIYAWRIFLENPSTGSAISGTLYFDDLRQNTTYLPPTSGTAKMTGTFLQLWNDPVCGNCGNWNQAQWEAQFDKMKAVCIDQVVVQYGVWTNVAWYSPTSLPSTTAYATLNHLFAAAEVKGIKEISGLYFEGEFEHSNSSDASYYNFLLSKNQTVIDDLWTLFGSSTAFGGWYIPQEIHDLYWRSETDKNLLANWLQNTAAYAKSKSSTAPVMIAPFFGPWAPADYTENWYNDVLAIAASVDWVVPQDGAGTFANQAMGPPHLKSLEVDVPHYLTAIKNACTAQGVTFGVDVELFSDPNPRTPASIDRVRRQLWEAGLHTTSENIFGFGWLFMQAELSSAAQELYNDYETYAACNPLQTSAPLPNTAPAASAFYEQQTLHLQAVKISLPATLHIVGASGQEAYNRTISDTAVPVGLLTPGVYHLLLYNSSDVLQTSFVVIE